MAGWVAGWLAGWLTDEYNTTLRPILRSLWDRIGLSSGPSVAIRGAHTSNQIEPIQFGNTSQNCELGQIIQPRI